MFCLNCGAKNTDDALFCEGCGSQLIKNELNANDQLNSFIWPEWKIEKLIGEGSFGKVYKAKREEFGETYYSAIKVISIPQNTSEVQTARAEGMDDVSIKGYFHGIIMDWLKEIKLMESLKAIQNIVSIEDYRVVEKTESFGWNIAIRMELLTSLNEYITNNKMTNREAIKLGIDICRALEFCQKLNIIHRDIKPENIFISKFGDFKLGDFGIARQIEKTTSGLSKKGTYSYMAPEIYKGRAYNSTVDIYSLGIVLYRFLNNNRTPFLPASPAAITFQDKENSISRRMKGELLPKPCNAEGRLAEIVLKACAYDPKDRYDSPIVMKEALEAILYTISEAPLIYPAGDILQNSTVNYYAGDQTVDETASVFGETAKEVWDGSNIPIIEDNASEEQIFDNSKQNEEMLNIGNDIHSDITAPISETLEIERENGITENIEKGSEKEIKQKKPQKIFLWFGEISTSLILGIKNKSKKIFYRIKKYSSAFLLLINKKFKEIKSCVGRISTSLISGIKNKSKKSLFLIGGISTVVIVLLITTIFALNGTDKLSKNDMNAAKVEAAPSQEGEWSSWVEVLPADINASKYLIEEKTQYQYSDKEFTTNTAKSLSGWTKYDETYDWGSWSGWSTTAVSASGTREINTRQVENFTWGSWSGWSTTAVSASGTREVNTRQTANPQQYRTLYNYNRWQYNNGGIIYSSYASGYGGFPGSWEYIQLTYPLNVTGSADGHTSYGNYGTVNKTLWWNYSTSQEALPLTYYTEYQYRDKQFYNITEYQYRDKAYTYKFYRFQDWSAWQDTSVSATADRKVNTQKIYRYKAKP